MTSRDRNDYLWDPTAPADPEVERLEALLSPLRYDVPLRAPAPALGPGRRSLRFAVPMAAAASVAILVGAAYMASRAEHKAASACEVVDADTPWAVIPESGTPWCADAPLSGAARLTEGRVIRTRDGDSATIRVADIGTVSVGPNSSLRLLRTQEREHRLQLERGRIHAQIDAPPRLFVVETASATAVDLGCEYTLSVDDRGNGLLHVTFGYVSLERPDGNDAWVPAGAKCKTREGIGPGTPFYEGTLDAFVDALTAYDFEGDVSALDRILALARPNDAVTLWHLLRRVDGLRRVDVYRRLAELAPPPDEVRQEDVLRADADALEAWRDDIEVVGFNPDGEDEN